MSDDPYVNAGVFERIPPPTCVEPIEPADDLSGDFEHWDFDATLGELVFAGDIDQNGRAELLVITGFDYETFEPRGTRLLDIYEFDDISWSHLGPMHTMWPHGVVDIDNDGVNELFGRAQYIGHWNTDEADERFPSYGATFDVRRDDAGAYRFDTSLFDFRRQIGAERWDLILPAGVRGNLWTTQATDLDQDGHPEFFFEQHNVLAEWTGEAFVRAWSPDDPVFGYGSSLGPSAFGDFDGDGQMEMAVSTIGPEIPVGISGNTYFDNHFRLLENRGDDTYVDIQRLGVRHNSARGAAAGDITGDGKDDLLVATGPVGCMRFQLWSSDRDDHLDILWEADALIDSSSSNVRMIALGDIDGDGDLEAAMNMGKILTVWDWRPDAASSTGGSFVQIYGEHMGRAGWAPLFVEDLDGDGRAEVITHDVTGGVEMGRLPEPWENPRGVLIRRLRR